MSKCYACGRSPCPTPQACALLKPSTFRRNERLRRERRVKEIREETAAIPVRRRASK